MSKRRYLIPVVLFMLFLCPLRINAETVRWCGSQLNGTERKMYDIIVKNYKIFKEGERFEFDFYDSDIARISTAMECFLLDYPEAYWIQSFWRGSNTIEPVFYSDAIKDKAETDAAIHKAMNYVSKYKTDLEKIRAINDYICNNTNYASTVHNGQSIIGGLLGKYGNKFVCAGHARLFQLLCVKNNIPCLYVKVPNHAFNYVKYNNKWYLVDVTFNHPFHNNTKKQIISHDYLLRGKDAESQYHDNLSPSLSSLCGNRMKIQLPEITDQSIIFMQDCEIDREENSLYYTGKPIEPNYSVERVMSKRVFLKQEGNTIWYTHSSVAIPLKENKDYIVTYSNNTNIGKAQVIFKGIGRSTGEVKKTFKIKKNNVSEGKIKKIKITGISHKIAAGKTLKLTARISPEGAGNKNLKWSSSNSRIATVTQSGKVTMKKNTGGKSVVITAKAKDSSGKKDTWSIRSMKGKVRSITIKGSKTVKAGKKLNLKAKVKASSGANKKLNWTSSNETYAVVTSKGKVKTYEAGRGKKVKITAMATDGTGLKKTVSIKIE